MRTFGLYLFALTLIGVIGCGKNPQTYSSDRVDSFSVNTENVYTQANQILQADYMFVLDISASMDFNSADPNPYSSKREEFVAGLDSFVTGLQSKGIDYRIGFINGNINAGNTQELSGRGLWQNIMIDWDMSTTQQNGLIDDLQSIGQTLNQNTNVLLQSTDIAMTNVSGTFNREGSQLVYLFVSDTDDKSNIYFTGSTAPTDYANKLIAHKGDVVTSALFPGFVSARAIDAGIAPSCTPNASYGESAGTRLSQTAQQIEYKNVIAAGTGAIPTSASVSRCLLRASTDFPTMLDSLARDVSKPTNLFKLQVTNAIESTIQVYTKAVGGQWTLLSSNQWSYDSASNSVKLTTVPAASTSVEVVYDQEFSLSGTPQTVSSLQVQVEGGGIIPQGGTNGWTYDSAANKITFHHGDPINGTQFPSNTTVIISYK